ncbi:MAG: undecaprenyl-phosphate glucose phosphotransferase [Anaerolineales bacterium]|nr:undecaprenyl-phosphate glucose phosphotransferase [Anaerolineales bacterium]
MSRTQVRTMMGILLVLLDVAAITVSFFLAYQVRRYIPADPVNLGPYYSYAPLLIVQIISILVVFFFYRLYHLGRAISRIDQFYSVFGGVSVGSLLAIAVASFVFKNNVFELDYPRAMILYAWVFGIFFVNVGRLFHQWIRTVVQQRGFGRDRVLIVGTGRVADMVLQKIRGTPHLGYEIVGVVNGANGSIDEQAAPLLGKVESLADLIAEHEIDEVIIALPEASHEELIRIISLCERGGTVVKVYPDLFQIMASQVSIDDLGGLPLISVRDVALRGWKLTLKRAMDLVVSAATLVVTSPIMLLVAILIKLESPGPVFYIQERMGLDSKPFMVIKFRSMRQDAEKDGPGWTTENDPRRTRLGTFLRRTNLDELPQFINVFLGEMSLVGPRPERPVWVQQFQQSIPRYMERHREKAGVTGWAQVNGLRGDTSIWERTKYDLWYIENWSFWLDVKIIIRTALQLITFSSRGY